jgi:hypothetical protein
LESGRIKAQKDLGRVEWAKSNKIKLKRDK